MTDELEKQDVAVEAVNAEGEEGKEETPQQRNFARLRESRDQEARKARELERIAKAEAAERERAQQAFEAQRARAAELERALAELKAEKEANTDSDLGDLDEPLTRRQIIEERKRLALIAERKEERLKAQLKEELRRELEVERSQQTAKSIEASFSEEEIRGAWEETRTDPLYKMAFEGKSPPQQIELLKIIMDRKQAAKAAMSAKEASKYAPGVAAGGGLAPPSKVEDRVLKYSASDPNVKELRDRWAKTAFER